MRNSLAVQTSGLRRLRNELSMQALLMELSLLPIGNASPSTRRWTRPGRAAPPSSSESATAREVLFSNMPDNPSVSCCNQADCYPTEIKYVDGELYAKRREDGKYIPIPPQKVERNRDNPDGRNHLCAPPAQRLPPIRYRLLLCIGGCDMRFVLVNGRSPCPQSFCALCCKPIGASYLREIETRISYCDDKCYAEHCEGAVLAIENHAKAS
jgi:hypothetical protein